MTEERWDPATRTALARALEVAVEAPWKAAEFTSKAKVGWYAIDELREAFDELGIDWRATKREHDRRKDELALAAQEARRARSES